MDQKEYFNVALLSRDDVARMIGEDAAADLTDDQMQEIAEGMWNDLMAEVYYESLDAVLEHMGFEIKATKLDEGEGD